MSSPQGLLGVRWGDSPSVAIAKLGVSCPATGAWEAWEGGGGVTACFDVDHPVTAFGGSAYVRLFRMDDRIEGMSLRFMGCGVRRDSLREAVRAEFKMPAGDGDPYQVWPDHALVHLRYDGGDDSCTLVLAGPRFGKPYAAFVLARGLGDLSKGLRPSH